MTPAVAGTLALAQTLMAMIREATGEDPDVILANARDGLI